MKEATKARVKLGGAITTVAEPHDSPNPAREIDLRQAAGPASGAAAYTLTPEERMCMIALRQAIAEAEQRFRGALTLLATVHNLPGTVSLNAEMTELVNS